MLRIALGARQPLPVGTAALAARTPLPMAAALLWVYRLLFVRPVGRRAREERLARLPERVLRDIGLERADLMAANAGVVRLADALPAYPGAGPLCICGRPEYRPTLVRLDAAA